ncbi:MAG: MATE family efflux transporter, partial [Acidimicrobiia bacterium]|nr:MATE family efflux transporter [Acidimicrobiia bacterium]
MRQTARVIGLRRTRYDREILALAIPALGTLAADPLVSLVDTAFVGRIGAVELAALAIAAAIFGVVFWAFSFLAYGTTPAVAHAVGDGDGDRASRVVAAAMTIALVAGFVALAGGQAGLRWMVESVMNASPEVAEPAVDYLRIRLFALPAVLLITAGHGVFRGFQDTRTPLVLSLGLNLINLVLDPILIFGVGLGITGAAWATLVAQWMGAVGFIVVLALRSDELGVAVAWPTWADVKGLLVVGGDLIVRSAALIGTLTFATAVAAGIGTVDVAAHHVAMQLWVFLALVVDALAISAQALVGKYRGSGDHGVVAALSARLVGMGLYAGIGLAVVMGAGWSVFPRLFSTDAAVVSAVGGIYAFVVLMQPLNAVTFVWDGIAMGAQAFRLLAVSTVVAGATAGVLLAIVGAADWPLSAVWWAIVAMMVVRAGWLLLWHRRWAEPGLAPSSRAPAKPG